MPSSLLAGLTIWAVGLKSFLLVQIPITYIAVTIGTWFFFVQHQYEDVYWAEKDEWNFAEAAVFGSSHYNLPAPLRWFSGNIGLHHIHHLRPRIPNYSLQRCHDAIPAMQEVQPLGFLESLKSLRMNLYDEAQKKLVSFRSLAAMA